MQNSLLPPGFLIFIKVSAVAGFFAAGAFIVALAYKGFKRVFGEEKAKKYRWAFILVNIPLLFVLIYIFFIFF
ncbi:hypothetical protein A2865_02375 [Candidatus Woesebacteria bacterium RIFCSPHIGHO2_01_FULL_39_17]|uniref:Uncharacterized protein n=1 Tax=Candidatus Woesebacteria bacterium RIFCSPLOWO2_01_FULL_39_14 TaxID=1802518 RepID=A0A1F8BLY0_9BACT|nr:MAG: hypothetical protein A2865_02375 [Candidatus Woesebacteria bacterium RIFCSPHIGHO2_01_FULL_39_17]OGM64278.1 MAG: hypothetical protein A3A52_03200 [Candidatus Woesebacteria bacterium RIFCSPLOWO2_01_FULL_39_14]